jgi:murein DD-endopeptidase MepM/ murein hydrolase activator NlpD
MIKWRIILLLLILSIISNVLKAQKDQNLFISPLKIPLSLSASFGELRADHFHSGIDIKTQGVTGKEVVASDNGYVYLLLVSPVGFGRASLCP